MANLKKQLKLKPMTICNKTSKQNKIRTILLIFALLCYGYIILAQSKQYTIIFHCPLFTQTDSSNTYLFNLEDNIEQPNENSYDTICVFAKEQIKHCDIVLKEIVSKAEYPEFSDQLIPLIAGKDSMFYMEDAEYVSVKRGLFKRTGTYRKIIRIPIPPEGVLEEKIIILEYLQHYYQCKHFRMLIETESKYDLDCWTKEEMNQLQQIIIDSTIMRTEK
jgi:hypothetical protein